mgnify:CR=1 FL=1
MDKIFKISLLSLCLSTSFALSSSVDIKEEAIALYKTGNYSAALEKLSSIPSSDKDETIFLLMANILENQGKDNKAIQYLNKSLDKNNSFYKAYYNLGCIFAKKKSYLLASNNFEFAIKYNKNFAPSYYNLACCQMKLKNYDAAKRNLIKALEFEPKNKDYLYNLAYCYKELNEIRKAKKIIETYNSLS